MDTFVWDEHFTTGLDGVDEQHHELVRLINQLGGSVMVGEALTDSSLQATFERLANYARQHFHDEETLMAQAGLAPSYRTQHHRRHADFIEQVGQMWATRSATSEPVVVLHGFLSAWLAMHILGDDQSMARQMLAVQSGASPAEALAREQAREDNATAALLLAVQSLHRVLARQNAGLVAANQQLELRVHQRTAALAEANSALTGLNAKLETLSISDGLLGIANRRRFDERLKVEWRRAARSQLPLSLLMIDVDHFKHYNDHYGHLAGDRCLQAVAQAAAAPLTLTRPADLLARYGGEELVVLLPETPSVGARAVAQDIQRAIAAAHLPHAASPVAPELTVSIGIATLQPVPGGDPDALVLAADAALYAAKAAGRNRLAEHSAA